MVKGPSPAVVYRRGASSVRRALAAWVDLLPCLVLLAVPYLAGWLSWRAWVAPPDRFWPDHLLEMAWHSPTQLIYPWLWLLLFWCVQHFLWLFLGAGRSAGMRLLSLRVMDREGSAPGPARIGLRVLGHLLSAGALGLGWLWTLVTASRRTWPDLLSGTLLVREGGRRAEKSK
jgi:uncharacterized RDD family membrane protein YckC